MFATLCVGFTWKCAESKAMQSKHWAVVVAGLPGHPTAHCHRPTIGQPACLRGRVPKGVPTQDCIQHLFPVLPCPLWVQAEYVQATMEPTGLMHFFCIELSNLAKQLESKDRDASYAPPPLSGY